VERLVFKGMQGVVMDENGNRTLGRKQMGSVVNSRAEHRLRRSWIVPIRLMVPNIPIFSYYHVINSFRIQLLWVRGFHRNRHA
jgi:hypothetical protein